MTDRVFRTEPLTAIIAELEARLADGDDTLVIDVVDPDLGRGCYAGELVAHAGEPFVHRPFRVWVDLAERLGLRLATPRPSPTPGLIRLRFERLAAASRDRVPSPERYGHGSTFARIAKLEDPGFVIDLHEAVLRARLGAAPRVLDLGVNTGDELTVIQRVAPACDVVGIDHSASALAIARARFPAFRFVEADLANLATLGLGTFDLVISLNTLQSPGVDDRGVLRQVVQHHLAPGGAVILGVPNSRYVDGEVVYGARMKNFRQPELGLLIKDVAFYRKYLQQHHRQVFVTGKHTVLITGVPDASAGTEPASDATPR